MTITKINQTKKNQEERENFKENINQHDLCMITL